MSDAANFQAIMLPHARNRGSREETRDSQVCETAVGTQRAPEQGRPGMRKHTKRTTVNYQGHRTCTTQPAILNPHSSTHNGEVHLTTQPAGDSKPKGIARCCDQGPRHHCARSTTAHAEDCTGSASCCSRGPLQPLLAPRECGDTQPRTKDKKAAAIAARWNVHLQQRVAHQSPACKQVRCGQLSNNHAGIIPVAMHRRHTGHHF